MNSKFYDLSATTISGKEINVSAFKGKVVLVVNTTSKCEFTPQLQGLEKLNKKFAEQGFVILGFHCNQFGNQEPGVEKSIEEGCIVNYGVTFQMFSKVDVNGTKTHPVFKYLKRELGGIFGSRIKWNFTKFLLDKKGNPVKRFSPTTKPEKLEKYVENLLKD